MASEKTMPSADNTHKQRRHFAGTVVRDKNDQTITIEVAWSQKHRIYKKARRRITRLVAHDEGNTAAIGDSVVVEQARPFSATKRWRLVEIVAKHGVQRQ